MARSPLIDSIPRDLRRMDQLTPAQREAIEEHAISVAIRESVRRAVKRIVRRELRRLERTTTPTPTKGNP